MWSRDSPSMNTFCWLEQELSFFFIGFYKPEMMFPEGVVRCREAIFFREGSTYACERKITLLRMKERCSFCSFKFCYKKHVLDRLVSA